MDTVLSNERELNILNAIVHTSIWNPVAFPSIIKTISERMKIFLVIQWWTVYVLSFEEYWRIIKNWSSGSVNQKKFRWGRSTLCNLYTMNNTYRLSSTPKRCGFPLFSHTHMRRSTLIFCIRKHADLVVLWYLCCLFQGLHKQPGCLQRRLALSTVKSNLSLWLLLAVSFFYFFDCSS